MGAVQELQEVCRLQESGESTVFLMQSRDGGRFVLKQFARPMRAFEMERDFYERCGERSFRFVHMPRLVESGTNHLLLEYVDRESHSRDSILTRNWTDEDVALWVDALLEFQGLRPDSRLFSVSRHLASLVYPVISILQQLIRESYGLSLRQKARLGALIGGYLLHRPAVRYVCTHYDLQTNNYAFMVNERRMSVLDFRFPYYLGDPYLDVLYYVSIPTVPLNEWTFQKRLVRRFLKQTAGRRGYDAGRKVRLRVLLLMCTMVRATHFASDPAKRCVYEQNLRLLLDDAEYDVFYRSLIEGTS